MTRIERIRELIAQTYNSNAVLNNDGITELLDLLEGMGEALRLYLAEHDNTYDGEAMSQEKYAALEKMRNSKDKFDAWNGSE